MNPFKSLLNFKEETPRRKALDSNNKSSLQTKLQNVMVKAVGQIMPYTTYNRDIFRGSEYNLEEIKDAIDTDSYIKIATLKYSCLIFKSGWKLKGDNQKAIDYVLKRFKYMSIATGKPIDILFQEIGDDLYKYSNAFLLKSRVESIPGINAKPALSNKIVGGYFRIDPTTIKIKRDIHGNVLKYEQGIGLKRKEFDPKDVIHIYMDRDGNNAFGTPRIVAALDDVKLLRKIEGNIVALIHRFSMPTYHWKIGLAVPGFQGTDPEITKAKREFEHSTLDGAFITNEKSEIKAIGAEGNAINAKPYLEYFEDRVFSALGVSASQMGRGGAKQDADSMEAQVHDTVKYVQRIMSIFIDNKIISELLLEGGFDIFEQKNEVRFRFEEISLETKIKKENHEINRYQSNVTTFEETRRNMSLKDKVDSEDRLYQNMMIKDGRLEEIDRTAAHTMELEKFRRKNAEKMMEKTAKQNEEDNNKNNSNKTSSDKLSSTNKGKTSQNVKDKKPRSTKNLGPNGAVKNNDQPKNQHGTHSVKVKESVNFSKKTKKQFKDVFKIYEELRNGINRDKDNSMLFAMSESAMNDVIARYNTEYMLNGMQDATVEFNLLNPEDQRLIPNIDISKCKIGSSANRTVKNLFKDIKKEIKNNDVYEVIDNFEYRLRFLSDFVTRKSYWYGYAMTGKMLGLDKAYLLLSEDDSEDREVELNLKSFTEDDIPAYHPYCSCKITFDKKKAGD